MGKNRRLLRPLARKPARYEPRARVLVVCEGVVTEPEYFRHVSAIAKNNLVEVIVDGLGGDPKHLVEAALAKRAAAEAAARKEPYLLYDQVWCAFDVDDHPRLQDALVQAKANGILVALSNPSFELWALLHFRDYWASIDRRSARRLLKAVMPGYAKSLSLEAMTAGIADACVRAEVLEKRHKANGSDGNPSSSVYRLCRVIMPSRP